MRIEAFIGLLFIAVWLIAVIRYEILNYINKRKK